MKKSKCINAYFFTLFIIWGLNFSLIGQVNVKDFGAKGDGVNDDTKAIENAIKFTLNLTHSSTQIPNNAATSYYIGTSPSIYFPSGIYVISNSIKFGPYIYIKGENAIITGSEKYLKNKENRGFEGSGWQVNIEGIQFIGFSSALYIDNNNVDMGKVNISNCSFYENQTGISLNARSSISIIEKCRFMNNLKSLDVISGDRVIFTQNWITSGILKGHQDANIINRGTLSFTENLLVPVPPLKDAIEPAWINNYGSISAEGVRQGGEAGSFTLVNNFTRFDKDYPIVPNFVVVKNSDCYSAYNNDLRPEPAVIRLIEIPNQIVMEDIRGAVDSKLISSSWARKTDIAKWIDQYASYSKIIKIRVSNIIGGIEENNGDLLPAYLKIFTETDNYQLAKSKNAVYERNSWLTPSEKRQNNRGSTTFKSEFLLSDISANYMIVYSGNPNVIGSGYYNGGLVINFKCNGVFHKGKTYHHLSTSSLFNRKDEVNNVEVPYNYSLVWQSTGTPYKLVTDENFNILLLIEDSTGNERLNIINISTLK